MASLTLESQLRQSTRNYDQILICEVVNTDFMTSFEYVVQLYSVTNYKVYSKSKLCNSEIGEQKYDDDKKE